jgi:hypothetical protein
MILPLPLRASLTVPAQRELHLIAERGGVIIGAGDDDQSIYLFRRAAPVGIRRFPDDYPGSANCPLSITQRCGARLTLYGVNKRTSGGRNLI